MLEFGHSEGTFKLKNILVSKVKVPSELRNFQCGVRESRFVVGARLATGDGVGWVKSKNFFFGHQLGPKCLGKPVC